MGCFGGFRSRTAQSPQSGCLLGWYWRSRARCGKEKSTAFLFDANFETGLRTHPTSRLTERWPYQLSRPQQRRKEPKQAPKPKAAGSVDDGQRTTCSLLSGGAIAPRPSSARYPERDFFGFIPFWVEWEMSIIFDMGDLISRVIIFWVAIPCVTLRPPSLMCRATSPEGGGRSGIPRASPQIPGWGTAAAL